MSRLNCPPRSEQRCLNCYYSCHYRTIPDELYCHKKPPALHPLDRVDRRVDTAIWPRVQKSQWCGSWAPIEES